MSIREQIQWRVSEGRLVSLIPRAVGARRIRALFLTRALYDWVNGPWENVEDEVRFSLLRADLEVFIEGRLIGPKYLFVLSPNDDRVWEIRSVEPNPSIRVLGRFAEKDVLVLTDWCLRSDLGGWNTREWRDARERCKSSWNQLFNPHQPLGGSRIHDFVSNAADGKYFRD